MSREDYACSGFGRRWGLAYAGVVFSLFLSVVFFILISVSYKTIYIERWGDRDSLLYLLFFSQLLLVSGVNYYFTSKGGFDNWVRKFSDVDQFAGWKLFDVLSSHYGNLASVGLLLAVVLYVIRGHFFFDNLYLLSIVLFLSSSFLFFVYGVFLTKVAIYLSGRPVFVSIPVFMLVIFIDVQGFVVLLSSIPD